MLIAHITIIIKTITAGFFAYTKANGKKTHAINKNGVNKITTAARQNSPPASWVFIC